MERRHKIEIGAAIFIILALVLLILWLLRAPAQNTVIDNGSADITEETDLTDVTTNDVPQPADPDTVSRVFVERLGSFSNQGDFENLEVIKDISTQSLKNKLDAIIADALREKEGAYYGVSTYVISIKELTSSDTEASYNITTQRQEAIGSPGNATVKYQDIVVYLTNISEEWLVNDFTWK
ncbi:hypothetical protein CO057_00135 [Candidatus Uhrbacteria bacterium CG_4_9_14_0_2_um_filter_41_50]|uniref:ARC6 IMS domain-containing protein n=1 Tax=Candidatus Uhrbacteria bacterium CG_4_9_14_0_2_um_filter_41_50 TaxID=1975031 RepID=A0A2M8EQD3_9BACT|nr:MAG: hypothetical protein COZ45_03280 [Candidatus Uhrbacteria bacterium CG_4_10_14_3_um_filter_41_21]PIZ55493.1 MAG: hypothetical protein COY24_00130 [Candidatus Uhrbacteria bacterium CG_4_10_14_0_2_um_filter_41_21]PJB84697.1 MAG: hypothetical protein CO086_02300 [Candidatus Uhrbacteria bacterium CG_4_9_14_0_8_um_filter_41_16]PJC24946.1 MAG: hypothetical protein CO057_00135 [Candidatus Uhrbacteria bacterium CG_4_9_14_0_2_um_filter_41_50]PJE74682.1 MAG: hypothetical protein COV03_04145 [Candi